jgi:hypothetical protein
VGFLFSLVQPMLNSLTKLRGPSSAPYERAELPITDNPLLGPFAQPFGIYLLENISNEQSCKIQQQEQRADAGHQQKTAKPNRMKIKITGHLI